MFYLTKSVNISIGHRLSGHEVCKNIHGHDLEISVTVMSKKLDNRGMVIDFKELEKIIKDSVSLIDHAFIYNYEDSLSSNIEKLLSNDDHDCDLKFIKLLSNPTIESIAKFIYYDMKNKLLGYDNIDLLCVKITEGKNSEVEFTGIL